MRIKCGTEELKKKRHKKIILHMNKLFKENHMTISIAIEKALDKIRYSFMI